MTIVRLSLGNSHYVWTYIPNIEWPTDQGPVRDYRPGRCARDYPPSWNIAPTTVQPVVRLSRDTHERELVPMRWGLVPYWAKDVKSLGLSTLNAQASRDPRKRVVRRKATTNKAPGGKVI
jgi:putative SOS response-associated peptidase YedK